MNLGIMEATRRRFRAVARRAAWGIGDQAISSLSNFGLGVLVARSVSPKSFGSFAIVFATYTVVVNVGNGLIAEPFIVRYSDVTLQEWRRAAASACGAALSLGLGAALMSLLVAWAVGGTLGIALVALAVALPGLVLQDTWLTLFYVRGRGDMSFLNDLVWAIVLFPALVAVNLSGHDSLFGLMLPWAGSASVAAVLACLQGGVFPRPSQTFRWLIDHKDLGPRFLGETMLLSSGQQLTTYGIAGVAGFTVAGAVRGAQMLLGPLYVVTLGIRKIAVPEAIRVLRGSATRMRQYLLTLAAGLSVVALALGTVTALMPANWGEALLGETWNGAKSAVFPSALYMAGSATCMAALIGLRALAAAKRSLKARAATMPLILIGGMAGAMTGKPWAAATGMALGVWGGAAFWWYQLKLAVGEHTTTVTAVRSCHEQRPLPNDEEVFRESI